MKIVVKKITDETLMRTACSFTINSESKMSLENIYRCEHSPMRTQIFWIEMYDIPTFVSVHFVRHSSVGQLHFVKSNREDRPGYTGDTGREHPVNHAMMLNAQHLVLLARKRLCGKSHSKTIEIMQMIKDEISKIDYQLAMRMVRECEYRGGCHELRPCGKPTLQKCA